MQMTSRFTIAAHMVSAVDYLGDEMTVTSNLLAGSIGANPVIVRSVMSKLKEAGILHSSQGKSGITLARPLEDISFYDIYKAVDCVDDSGLFHFHEQPNPNCSVGRNIHTALDGRLQDVQDTMEQKMKSITMAEVVADIRKANS